MARMSSIAKLPPEIREEIGRLRLAGQTIDDILDHLRSMPAAVDVSRSALGRHVQNLDKYEEMIRQSRGLSEALVEKMGDAPESRVARFNIEMMHAVMMRMMLTEEGKPAQFSPEEMMFLGRMLKDLASAKKTDVEALQKIEERAAARARTEAATAAESVAKERGLSAETVQAIRAQILGVKAPMPAAKAE